MQPSEDHLRVPIHHNTVRASEDAMLSIRGTPATGAWVENNWFFHEEDGAILQEKEPPFDKVTVTGNHYGETAPSSCDVGAPREGC